MSGAGTGNYALWVDDGTSRFDGTVSFQTSEGERLQIYGADSGATTPLMIRGAYLVSAASRGMHFKAGSATSDFTFQDSSGTVLLGIDVSNGKVFINDDTNVNMTTGLTINQGTADDHIFALKSSDINHGITTVAETDTYGFAKKQSAAGGLNLVGLAHTGTRALAIEGIAISADTNKTYASGDAAIILKGWMKDGTGTQVLGADGNILAIHDGATGVRFIFDVEGSGHADVEWTTFDTYDDLSLINDIEKELVASESTRGTEHRHMLENTGIIGKDSWHVENGRPRAMVNMTKLSMLHHGALMQAADKIKALENRLLAIEGAK